MITHFQRLCKDNEPDDRGLPYKISPSSIACDWCDNVFDNLTKALKHKWSVHKYDAFNYDCQHCGTMFAFQVLLDRHIEQKHQNLTDEQITDDTFECTQCSLHLTTQEALDTHMKTAHIVQMLTDEAFFVPGPSIQISVNSAKETVSVYYCHWCGCDYVLKFNLRNHLIAHHKEKLHSLPEEIITCNLCEAVFFCRKAFEVHNRHSVNDVFVSNDKQR